MEKQEFSRTVTLLQNNGPTLLAVVSIIKTSLINPIHVRQTLKHCASLQTIFFP